MARRIVPSRRTVLAAPLVAGLSALTACGQEQDPGLAIGAPTSSRKQATFRLGLLPIIDVAPIYLGMAKGYFAGRGLTLEPIIKQTGADIVKGVISGELDAGISNVVSLLIAREAKQSVIAFEAASSTAGLEGQQANGIMVGKGSELRGAKDLVGRRVAVNAVNNVGDTTVRAAVKKAGGDPYGVEFVEIPFPSMPTALAAGKVDACWETEPFVSAIKAAGGRLLVDNLGAVYPKMQIALYFTTMPKVRSDRSMLSRFKAALGDSLLYARDHQVQVREILGTYTKIPRDLAAVTALPDWPVGTDEASVKAIGDAAREFGTLRRAPDVEGLIGYAL